MGDFGGLGLEVLDEGVGGEVGQERGEVEGEGTFLGVTAATFATAATSTTTAVAASVWRRVVVLGLLILVGSDLCWIGSIRVSHHGIRRARLLLLLLRGLRSVRGRGRGGLLLGSLSSVTLLLLLLLPWATFVARVCPVGPSKGTSPWVRRRAMRRSTVRAVGWTVRRSMRRSSTGSMTAARAVVGRASGTGVGRLEEGEAPQELRRGAMIGASVVRVEVADEVPEGIGMLVSHDDGVT